MKIPYRHLVLVGVISLTHLALSAPAAAAEPSASKLTIVVVESLQHQRGAITDFDRIDMAFEQVAKERNWPIKTEGERFAANTEDHEIELRVFPQPIREEIPGEMVFRGWMTLMNKGTKHDFGVVTFRYHRRAGEPTEDVLEKVFRGAALKAADKLEPILFPDLRPAKS